MENNLKIIDTFELEQLESFNSNETVKKLISICSKLGLQFDSRVDHLEKFNLKECSKRKLLHSGYLVFEVICDGRVVEINDDDYGLLSWADAITELKQNGKYKLFKWNVDDELLREVNKSIEFLQKFESKDDLTSYLFKKYQ